MRLSVRQSVDPSVRRSVHPSPVIFKRVLGASCAVYPALFLYCVCLSVCLSVSERIKKFYRCANSIFRIDGYSDELVMLQLAESHCIPLLTYAIEIVHVANRDERRQLRVAYNAVFRKIFGYRRSQSVSELQKFLGKPTWEELVESRKNKFLQRLSESTVSALARIFIT